LGSLKVKNTVSGRGWKRGRGGWTASRKSWQTIRRLEGFQKRLED
jgi:hypothetical protein